MTIGSLLRFSKDASYWAFSVVGNWAERFRMFAHVDVTAQQEALEKPLFGGQVRVNFSFDCFWPSCDVIGVPSVELFRLSS